MKRIKEALRMNGRQFTAVLFLTILTVGSIAMSPGSAAIPVWAWIGFVFLWPGLFVVLNLVDAFISIETHRDRDLCG